MSRKATSVVPEVLEKLYTRKVIIALMAVILAANGLLLYQFRIAPPTETANTPSSEGSPEAPEAPNNGEPERPESPNDEDPDETNGNETQRGPDNDEPEEVEPETEESDSGSTPTSETPPTENRSEEAPPVSSGGASSPETPFDSQYEPLPTSPSVPGSADGSGGLDRIQVALASLYGSGEGGGGNSDGGSGEVRILPATSGVGFVPVSVVFGGALLGAAIFGVVFAALRRR